MHCLFWVLLLWLICHYFQKLARKHQWGVEVIARLVVVELVLPVVQVDVRVAAEGLALIVAKILAKDIVREVAVVVVLACLTISSKYLNPTEQVVFE